MIDMLSSQSPYGAATPGLPDGAAQLPLQHQLHQLQQAQLLQQYPMLQQLQQQPLGGQFAPQGILGSVIGHLGAPIGGAIGGLFGNQGLGQTIGGLAGRLGSLLPFQQDIPQYYGQPQMPQPDAMAYAQQFAPQGFFGNLIGRLGAPVGGAIGGLFGQPGIGQTIGGLAGRLGSMLPFQQGIPQIDAYGQSQFPGLPYGFQQTTPQFGMPQGFAPPASLPIQYAQQPGLC